MVTGDRETDRDRQMLASFGADYAYFCRKMKQVAGVDLESYKPQQMHRRLDNYRNRLGAKDFVTLARMLVGNKTQLEDFRKFITINVSEFFRNPEQWQSLRERVLPLISKTGPVKTAWSAGCAAGQEPYSLAMLFEETGHSQARIIATDLDVPSLNRAQIGLYSAEEIKGVPRYLLTKYFKKQAGDYQVSEVIRRMVDFYFLDLLKDPYPSDVDLILCRNVLIYFTASGKDMVVRRLVGSLRRGGALFVGATEAIFSPKDFGLIPVCPFFYVRE